MLPSVCKFKTSFLFLCFADIDYRANEIVQCVNMRPPYFSNFHSLDLERLKNDNKWLSDTHVTLGLLFVFFFSPLVPHISKHISDCFRDCTRRKIWGNKKIKLLDTMFWQQLSKDPDLYKDGYRRKNNLLECDFAVMPMFDV